MIEGNLSDVSLPGLLQFLATESNKSYSVQLTNGTQKGEVIVCDGEILAANFSLLEGNDALTEFLFWNEGTFIVERLAQGATSAESCNLKIPLKQVNTFADQMLFLQKSNVGLNTEIVPSPKFGTQEWQEALQKQPLYKEDYVVLGWVTDGRTMRQAMREFSFDVVQATNSLFRLLSTGSVDSIRPSLDSILDQVEDLSQAQALVDKAAATAAEEVVEKSVEKSADKSGEKSREKSAADKSIKPKGTDGGANKNGHAGKSQPAADLVAELSSKQPEIKSELKSELKSEPKIDSDFAPDSKPEPAPTPAPAPAQVQVPAQVPDPVVIPEPVSTPVAEAEVQRPAEVITSDSLPAVGSAEFNELMAKAQTASLKNDDEKPGTQTSVLEKPKAQTSFKPADVEPEPEKKSFDIRRTDPLPLVAIDIERLFQTCFHVAPFGQVALNNDALDDDLKKIVSAFKTGKTFINVATDGGLGRDPAQVLHNCKYALERGYIDPPDQVVSLTADLLLGRVELEQYLLQRRRLNGDELRDVIELARQKGVKLVELLVKMGFMTDSDWDRLTREKERFAPR